ncbi:MAG: hypothetical protein R3A79_11275 [Nannocystaceae bacterium]
MLSLNYRMTIGGVAALLASGCLAEDLNEDHAVSTAGATTSAGDTDTDDGSSSGGGGLSDSASESTDGATTSEPTSTSTGTGTGPTESFPCQSAEDAFPLTLQVYDVELALTRNGEDYAASPLDNGYIYLVNEETGDRARIGEMRHKIAKAKVLAGEYSIVYEAATNAMTMPRNARAVLREHFVVDHDIKDAVDVTSVDVDLTFTIDGDAPPKSAFASARLFVRSRDGDPAERTVLGSTAKSGGTFTAPLVPGAYEVFYELEKSGAELPHNTVAKVHEFTIPQDHAGAFADDVKVAKVALAGAIKLNGGAPPPSSYDHGLLYVRDQVTGAVTKIGDTANGAVGGTSLIASEYTSYELFYAADEVGELAPANRWGRLIDDVLPAGMLAAELAELDIETIAVTGAVKVDGQDPVDDPNNRGEVLIGAGADRAVIGELAKGIQRTVLRGSYGLYFRHEVSDGGVPANTYGLVDAAGVSENQIDALAIDVETTLLHGAITVGGGAPPNSVYADGRLLLRRGDDSVYLGNTRHGAYSQRVVNGTYDLYYAVESTNGQVPGNHELLLAAGLTIEGGDMIDNVDVPHAHSSDWEILPPDGVTFAGEARYLLRKRDGDGDGSLSSGDEILVGGTDMTTLDVAVAPGDYLVIYRLESTGTDTPVNEGGVVACVTIGG